MMLIRRCRYSYVLRLRSLKYVLQITPYEDCYHCRYVEQVYAGRQSGPGSVIVSVGLQGEGCAASWHSEASPCW